MLQTRAHGSATAPPELLRSFYPAMNGLRGLAILVVFLDHYGAMVRGFRWLTVGWVGVDIFFVLSGFLITGGLFDRLAEPGYFRVFYAKRTLRIFPLYYAVWAVFLFLRYTHHADFPKHWWLWLLYLGNLKTWADVVAGNLFSLHAIVVRTHAFVSPLEINQFWSLCVEEQFYLVWPLLVYLLRDRRKLMATCVLLAALSLAARLYIFHTGPYAIRHSEFLYHQTYVRLDGMFMGAFIALWLRGNGPSRFSYAQLLRWSAVVPGVCLTVYFFARLHQARVNGVPLVADLSTKWISTFGFTLVPLLGTALLLGCLPKAGSFVTALSWRPLQELGKISYGFYIFHNLPRELLETATQAAPGRLRQGTLVLLWFGACWLISELSFRFFERPFLKVKDRLFRHG